MCQLVPVGTDLTGASGSLWALCNTWAIALVQPLVPPLGQQEVVPTGVDGALCISLAIHPQVRAMLFWSLDCTIPK